MKDKKNEIDMIKTNDTSKTIDRELSLSFEGVGRNKTNTESVRLENWPKFPCVSEVRPREQGEGRGAYSVFYLVCPQVPGGGLKV